MNPASQDILQRLEGGAIAHLDGIVVQDFAHGATLRRAGPSLIFLSH